jgi:hypothetical protein
MNSGIELQFLSRLSLSLFLFLHRLSYSGFIIPTEGGNFIPDGGTDPFSEMWYLKEIILTLSVVHIFIFRTDS